MCAPAVNPLQPLRQHCVSAHDCLCTMAQSSPHVSKARLNMKYCMFKCHHGKQGKHNSKCKKTESLKWMYGYTVLLTVLLLNHRHTESSPGVVKRKVCQIAYSLKYKAHWRHCDTFPFFSPFFPHSLSSLFFTLDIFSLHFPLKKHFHIWVVLTGPQKNKSGNKDTKWPRKMARLELCNLIMFGGQMFKGYSSMFFQIVLWTKSVTVLFCGFKYHNLVSIVLMAKCEPALHSVYQTRYTYIHNQMLELFGL